MNSVSSSHRVDYLRALPKVGSLVCYVLTLLAHATPAPAADRAAEFLAGLRQRGWHDVVLEYLDRADEDPLTSEDFLDRIDFERAVTKATLARGNLSEKRRTALVEQATMGFQQFAESHRDSPFYFEALSQAGKLFTEQALFSLAKIDRLPEQAGGERDRLRTRARELFDEATSTVEALLEACETKLQSLPKAAALQRDPAARATRLTVQTKQAEGKFLLANISFEKARTYKSDSEKYAKTLADAADDFAKLSKEYEGKVVGFYGRLYEGRCHQAAGDTKTALNCYEDLVGQPSGDPKFRTLVARAYRHRAECHLADGNVDEAIHECRDWLSEARGEERRQAEWLAVSFRLAGAYQTKAEDSSERGNAGRLRSDARKLFREVARQPGEFQSDARAILASVSTDDEPINVKTFDDAFAAGKGALDQMNSSMLAVKLAAENNPEAVEDLQQQADRHKKAALKYLQESLRLADEETSLDDLLASRYYLCWLYWEGQRLHDAGVLGEFLARRYPENKFAPGAAKLALASYERLTSLARQSESAVGNHFEVKRLASIAELIVQRWPESDEAATAMKLLINIALREDRLEDAEQLLEKLPANRRAAAELSLGGSMWTRYLQLTSNREADPDAETTKLKQRATELLSRGFEALRETANPSVAEATGVLYLVQLLLAQGESEQAVEVLEDRSVGPLKWVQQKINTEQRPEFVRETYKTALRAYVSVEPPQRNKARQMMEALEKAIGGQGDAQQQLTNIYVSLGLQLQRQISELSTSGKTDKARAVAASFEDLLDRVTKRGGANDWKIRNWIAHTNLQLGSGLRGEDAERYLEQAEQAYREILAEVDKQPDFAPSELALLGVRKRLGDCLRAEQKYEEAFEQYTQILAKKPNMLELQQAAAELLQDWGNEESQLEKLEFAIRGTLPQANKKNLVWGWLRLATIADYARKKAEQAQGDEPANQEKVAKYQDLFFEARYNSAKARFTAAQLTGGANGKKQLRTARQSVASMKRLYPDLGGPKWQRAFDDLLQQMDQPLASQ